MNIYKTIKSSSFFFYGVTFFLFFLDITAFNYFEQQYLFSILALYSLTISQPKISCKRTSVLLFLLSLQFFLGYGTSGLPLVFLLVATLATLILKLFTDHYFLLSFLFAFLAVALQSFVVESYLFQMPVDHFFTLYKLCGIFVTIVVLKFLYPKAI